MSMGRNDPCPCGSGKKVKKCCGFTKGRKPLKASIISSGSLSKMSSLFQKGISQNQEKSDFSIKEKISTSAQAIVTKNHSG